MMKNYVLCCLSTCIVLLFSSQAVGQITWQALTTPPGTSIEKIVADGIGAAYLETSDGDVFVTNDDGGTWAPVIMPVDYTLSFWAVEEDGDFYAFFGYNMYRLPNGAEEWIELPPLIDAFVHFGGVLTAYPNGDVMFVDYTGEMFYLPEGASAWNMYYENTGAGYNRATIGDNGYYFIGTHDHQTRCSVTGDSPVEIDLPVGLSSFTDFKRHPEGGMLMVGDNLLFRSEDNGDTWLPLPLSGVEFIDRIGFGANHDIYLYSLNSENAYRSQDDGMTWELLSELLVETIYGAVPVAMASGTELFYRPRCDYTILIRSPEEQVYDNITYKLTGSSTYDFIGNTSDKLFARTCNLDWQQSNDQGDNWELIRVLGQAVAALDIGPNDEYIVLTKNNRVYIASAGNLNWSEVNIPGAENRRLTQVYYLADNLFAVTDDYNEIYYTTDGGNSFQNYVTVSHAGMITYDTAGYLFVSHAFYSGDHVERIDLSNNTGELFGAGILDNSRPFQFTSTPSGAILYLGHFIQEQERTRLYRSDDMGENFTLVLADNAFPFSGDLDQFITVDENGNLYLFMGDEIRVSTDDGLSWTAVFTDLPEEGRAGIHIDDENYLYLFYHQSGVYRSAATLNDFALLNGTSWNDINGDCSTIEADEFVLFNTMVRAEGSNATFWASSNTEGYYGFSLPEGGYILNSVNNNPLYLACAVDVPVTVTGGEEVTVDIPLEPVTLCPLVAANISTPFLRRCFDNRYTVNICNYGTLPSAQTSIDITLDDFFTLTSSMLDPVMVDGQTYTFEVGALTVSECTSFQFLVNVSCEAELGQEHCINWATTPGNECAPSYQTDADQECQNNRDSFDPNDKRAFVDGQEVTDYLLPETERMTYHIRFQNTGTDTAFTVVVKDELPEELEVASFHLENSSHPCEIQFVPGLVPSTHRVEFTFNDILLPDSTTNEAASHGFVKFSIDLKDDIELGEAIPNFADIFFDFNAPIRTDTVDLEYNFPNAVSSPVASEALLELYPNPTQGWINIVLKDELLPPLDIIIYDTNGKAVVQRHLTEKQTALDLSTLPAGLYFLRAMGNGKIVRAMRVVVL